MSPSIVDEIYKLEKILGKWSYPGKAFLAILEVLKLKFSPDMVGPPTSLT